MEINQCVAFPISDDSHVAEARRASQIFALDSGFDEVRAGKLAIICTEAATNLIKHAGEGEIVFRILSRNGVRGVEMLAFDRGPGMDDPELCMQDGFTTAGTQGSGLGAIRRQADEFDIYSLPGKGTVLSARLWSAPVAPAASLLECDGVAIPLRGEEVCGDAWACKTLNGIDYLMVCDGLGHGVFANQASMTACRIFAERDTADIAQLLREIHAALRSTRGAAIAVAAVNPAANTVLYGGVGNIAGVIIDGADAKHMVSVNGTMGHNVAKFPLFTYEFPPGAAIVMHSDGLQTKWALNNYPGIARAGGGILPAILYRDFARGRDDATVVELRRAA